MIFPSCHRSVIIWNDNTTDRGKSRNMWALADTKIGPLTDTDTSADTDTDTSADTENRSTTSRMGPAFPYLLSFNQSFVAAA